MVVREKVKLRKTKRLKKMIQSKDDINIMSMKKNLKNLLYKDINHKSFIIMKPHTFPHSS